MAFTKTYTTPTLVCPLQKGSGYVQTLTDRDFADYFAGRTFSCRTCNAGHSLWELGVAAMQLESQLFRASSLAFIGARSSSFFVPLGPDATVTVALPDFGIPASSRILYSVYTACGGEMVPFEWRSNEPDRPRDRHTMSLYGRPIPTEHKGALESGVSFMVQFIDHPPDEHGLSNLLTACERFLWDDFTGMVMPASVAVEDTVKRAIDSLLSAHGLPAARDVSMESRLSVVLPLLGKLNGFPPLPQVIHDRLRNLRKQRNELAHEGRLKQPLSLDDAAPLLCAAIFVYRYLRLYGASANTLAR